MLTPEQITLIDSVVKRQHDSHVSRLLAAGNLIKTYDPQSPASVKVVYEGFLLETDSAISGFSDDLVDEVLRVVKMIAPTIDSSEKEQVLEVCEKYLDSNLYTKRRNIFEEGLERKIMSNGQTLDLETQRVDLFRSRYNVCTVNLIRRVKVYLRDELELLVIAKNPKESNEVSAPSIGDVVGLKPGLFGFSLDLKNLAKWWKWRR